MKPIKILIVEDNKPLAGLFKEICLHQGWEVLSAFDGAVAVELAKQERPDVMLLDIMIPNKDGFEVCQLVHEDPKTSQIKIIMVTALDRKVDVDAALAVGAVDYIIKPFDSKRLVEKIQKLFKR